MRNLTFLSKLSAKLIIPVIVFGFAFNASAQESYSTSLSDLNGDGLVEMMAFGDSITRGVGDFFRVGEETPVILPSPPSEAGYPLRLENILGVNVYNNGVRGESLTRSGVFRFAQTAASSPADYVLLLEGANDVFYRAAPQSLRRNMQALINISKALGKEPILLTIPSPCCGHIGSKPFIDSFNQEYRDLADLNEIKIADVDKAFAQTCTGSKCFLFNIPDGLHPNSKGYDAIAETIIAALYGIDLLGPGGSLLLAQALGIDPSQIVVKSKAHLVNATDL